VLQGTVTIVESSMLHNIESLQCKQATFGYMYCSMTIVHNLAFTVS
jgi:hypothetical protein